MVRLRMSRAVPQLVLYAFMPCARKTLPYLLPLQHRTQLNLKIQNWTLNAVHKSLRTKHYKYFLCHIIMVCSDNAVSCNWSFYMRWKLYWYFVTKLCSSGICNATQFDSDLRGSEMYLLNIWYCYLHSKISCTVLIIVIPDDVYHGIFRWHMWQRLDM
jgi:hypothetical protein